MEIGAKRAWVFVADVKGRFQQWHRRSGFVLLVILAALPWVRIGGRPVALFDLPARQLFLAGGVFTPRDTILLLGLLLVSALSLFFFTSLYGRLWCGFACPQTVFLEEIIRPIERWIDGNRGAQRKLADGPWTPEKIRKRALKWTAFAAVAAIASLSFTGFFVDAYTLWVGDAARGAYLFAAAIGGILFLDFVWFREQFCNYLCPYARFQGVMTDEHSLVVGYDGIRGEPRRQKGIKLPKDALGECVGCNLCVTVCPTGIDIRDGFQLECISCARCIDACEDVMGRQGAPSLVNFTSLAELERRPRKRFRVRPVLYASLLALVLGAMAVVLVERDTFEFTIAQPPGAAESIRPDGRVQNLYQLTLFNNGDAPASFEITVEGLQTAEVVVPGGALEVAPAAHRLVPVFVIVDDGANAGSVVPFSFVVSDGQDRVLHPASFRNHLISGTP